MSPISHVFEILGASVVAMPSLDSVEALQRHAIDAVSSFPFDSAVSIGVYEIVSYGSDLGGFGAYAVFTTTMNQNTWNGLDPQVQAAIEQVASEVPAQFMRILDEDIDNAVEKVRERVSSGKLTINTFSTEDAAHMKEQAAQSTWQYWLDRAKQQGADGEAALKQFRELVARHEANSTYRTGFERLQQ